LAKKTAAKRTTKKKATKKPARAAGASSRSKKTAKKTAKKTVKKTAAKKVTKKPAAKKTSKKGVAKKVAKKPTKKTAKRTAKKVVKKPASKQSGAKKKPVVKKTVTKKTPVKKTAAKKSPAKKAPSKSAATSKAPASKAGSKATSKKTASKTAAAPAKDDKATNRKGITIVKPTGRRTGGRSRNTPKFVMPDRPQLLGPGSAFAKKPLIPSGPSAPKITSVFDEPKSKRKKSPLTKLKLEKFRLLLINKRAELLGDVTNMENEALRSGGSGGLSNTPQHAAEQGSENYDQSLSLNLAAQDRRLIKDIDDALARVEAGTYGLCELTGHPIPEERLTELPWARYTIEAARELERRGGPA